MYLLSNILFLYTLNFDIMILIKKGRGNNMKIIDICEGYAAAGCLKHYYKSNSINDYIIFPLGMSLSIGDIKYNRIDFLRKFYQDDNYNYTKSLNEILNSITNDTIIRIWSSKKNDDEYMLLLFLCNFLKDKTNKINVIFASDYNEFLYSINALEYKEIRSILKYEKTLSKDEIEAYAKEWNDLVEINSELRVLENGEIKNKKYSDYYDIILNTLKEIAPCKISILIAECMGKEALNNTGDLVYLTLIDKLIDLNKIKIVEKGTRHFVDTIDLSKN